VENRKESSARIGNDSGKYMARLPEHSCVLNGPVHGGFHAGCSDAWRVRLGRASVARC
jgi:hypothetical protein